ncbi:MAG: patatin-like phospholipase family protein [Anaerolineales bacterium]|nr:patatin-like phospholipase family protein [Anaerolineales bacterium]
MAKYFRILSLDGGGIRGTLTAVLLKRLEQIQPGFLSKIDLFAGTSTGGILALGLAAGLTPDDCKALYVEHGQEIFANPVPDWLDGGGVVGARYPNDNLVRVLTQQFGDRTLGDLQKNVLISSFDLDNFNEGVDGPEKFRTWKAKFFHNFVHEERGSDAAEAVVDVAMRTSAAPTYFPVYDGYVDGGVVANNPSLCALAQALDSGRLRKSEAEATNVDLGNVVLISLGTGRNQQYITRQQGTNLGLVQWAHHLVSILIDGTADVADYQCRQILGPRYCRINPTLREDISLDSYRKTDRLIEYATDADISHAVEWLRTYFADD